MRIFKALPFIKWAKKERLTDELLSQAVHEIEQGLVDADLGGCVYKKRIALHGRGKSGGVRTILAYKSGDKVCFLFGYVKNEKVNLTSDEKTAAKKLAAEFFSYSENEIDQLLQNNVLIEVNYYG